MLKKDRCQEKNIFKTKQTKKHPQKTSFPK